MKCGHILLLPVLICVGLCSVRGFQEELLDFEFDNLKEIDWNYSDDDRSSSKARVMPVAPFSKQKHQTSEPGLSRVTFADDFDEENQVHPFDWRERILRAALSKALTNAALRQKFVEVMPILRVLSSQQRLALSALISAQMNARQGQELKLDQVRMMFGDDKKLLLPIVFDIANLIRNSARKFLPVQNDVTPIEVLSSRQQQPLLSRRTYDVMPAEETEAASPAIGALEGSKTVQADDSSLEDFFFNIPMDDMMDPKSINEELQSNADSITTKTGTNRTANSDSIKGNLAKQSLRNTRAQRRRRATEFVHKLIRSIPLSVNEDDLLNGAAGRTMKLNTTFFMPHENIAQKKRSTAEGSAAAAVNAKSTMTTAATTTSSGGVTIVTPAPTTSYEVEQQQQLEKQRVEDLHQQQKHLEQQQLQQQQFYQLQLQQQQQQFHQQQQIQEKSYQNVEDLVFAGLNARDLNSSAISLPFVAATNASDVGVRTDGQEPLPNPEELIGGPRYRLVGGSAGNNRVRPLNVKVASKRKRIQARMRPKPPMPLSQSSAHAPVVVPKNCERFTASMCIRADDYPLEQIMGSIRRHKNAMTALLAEYHDDLGDFESKDEFEDYLYNKKRREDEEGDGKNGMCPSVVRYARPQKARSASGEWKYIVNTGQHTQTLRMEKCSTPQESCSYLAQNYRSRCAQVYNYHRLLSWDKTRGLHVDIFKVPICCSCQIDGYRQQFPPLSSLKGKDYSPAFKSDLYTTISDDLDYQEEDEDDILDYPHPYGHAYKKHKSDLSSLYDPNELLLGSSKVRTQVFAPNPTTGPYLSPPSNDDYGSDFAYKRQRAAGSPVQHNLLQQQGRRRPYKSLANEDRVDLEIAPSEQRTDKEVNIFDRNSDSTVRVHPKRKRIYSVPHTATSATSTDTRQSGSAAPTAAAVPAYYTPSSSGVGGSGGSSSSSSSSGSSFSTTFGNRNQHKSNKYKNKNIHAPRLPAAASSPPSASAPAFISFHPTPTSSTASPYYTSEVPSRHHVNSVYSSKYGDSVNIPASNSKRINYSYHPIIDFFENNTRSSDGEDSGAPAAGITSITNPSAPELVYRHTIPNSTPLGGNLPPITLYQSRHRMGYRAAAAPAAAAGESDTWQPVVAGS